MTLFKTIIAAATSGHFLHAAGGEWQAQGVVDFLALRRFKWI